MKWKMSEFLCKKKKNEKKMKAKKVELKKREKISREGDLKFGGCGDIQVRLVQFVFKLSIR